MSRTSQLGNVAVCQGREEVNSYVDEGTPLDLLQPDRMALSATYPVTSIPNEGDSTPANQRRSADILAHQYRERTPFIQTSTEESSNRALLESDRSTARNVNYGFGPMDYADDLLLPFIDDQGMARGAGLTDRGIPLLDDCGAAQLFNDWISDVNPAAENPSLPAA
jgi:hypothetical protein